jgi:hypothetical protein
LLDCEIRPARSSGLVDRSFVAGVVHPSESRFPGLCLTASVRRPSSVAPFRAKRACGESSVDERAASPRKGPSPHPTPLMRHASASGCSVIPGRILRRSRANRRSTMSRSEGGGQRKPLPASASGHPACATGGRFARIERSTRQECGPRAHKVLRRLGANIGSPSRRLTASSARMRERRTGTQFRSTVCTTKEYPDAQFHPQLPLREGLRRPG